MGVYEVFRAVSLTAEPGSLVVISDSQAALVGGVVRLVDVGGDEGIAGQARNDEGLARNDEGDEGVAGQARNDGGKVKLSSMTKAELIAFAGEKGLKAGADMTKAQIIAVIEG